MPRCGSACASVVWGATPSRARAHSGQSIGEEHRRGRRKGVRRGGKKEVKGRKRHLLVDTRGLVLEAEVTAANIMDRDGIKPPLLEQRAREEAFARLSHLWLDAGYDGKGKGKDRVEKGLGLTAQAVRRPPKVGYVLWVEEGEEPDREKLRELLCPSRASRRCRARRWVVERTLSSWVDRNRRMSEDHERLRESSEAFIYYVAMSSRLRWRGDWHALEAFRTVSQLDFSH